MEAERQRALANRSELIAIGIGILALLILVIAVVDIFKNRVISRKNRLLAQQIAKEAFLSSAQRTGMMLPVFHLSILMFYYCNFLR